MRRYNAYNRIGRHGGWLMKIEDYFKGEATAVKHCPVRSLCPMGVLCGVDPGEGRSALYPVITEVGVGELAWADLRHEQRVFVIKQGIFACMTDLEQNREVPFALYGCAYGIGHAELYIPRQIASAYFLRALTPGVVCSFSAKSLKHHLEALPGAVLAELLSCSLINLSAASHTQARIVSQARLYDRIVLLLIRLKELMLRDGGTGDSIALTHGQIASLVAADRAATTRALRKVEEDGLVELGYRSLRILDAVDALVASTPASRTEFHVPSCAL